MDRLSVFLFFLLDVCSVSALSLNVNTFDFFMPFVYPDKKNLFVCTQIEIRDNFYLVGFQAKMSEEFVYTMLLYGCSEPGSNYTLWTCEDTPVSHDKFHKKGTTPCRYNSQIITAFARNASSIRLPGDVGFYVGKNSPIKYLVLQVRYRPNFPDDYADNSGVILNYTKESLHHQAGVILVGARGSIPAKRTEHLEATCTITEDKIIYPFVFNVHTNKLGKVVSGYVVRQGAFGDSWTVLGKKNPQISKMFYPVRDTTQIRVGDILAVRCTMDNTRTYTIRVGNSDKDEQCNFYLMYWVKNDTPLHQKYCFSPGPPKYYWNRTIENFQHIPDVQASLI